MRRLVTAVAAVVALAVCAFPAGAAAAVPNINWTALLPALPTPSQPQPGPVPTCRVSSVACVQRQAGRLERLRDKLGCDHRAIFATTYMELTKTFIGLIQNQPDLFQYKRYLYTEDAVFANVYFNTFRAYNRGEPVPPAWRIAFETAADGQVNAAQDMLLGINAHVQNDMPFVIASLGVRTPGGKTRKPDHDAVNAVLNQAYAPVVEAITSRYDSLVGITNSPLTPVDDIAGLELVRIWREGVWRNAERLLNAKDAAERARIAKDIESYAAGWASGIALIKQPGYGAIRDSYCAAHVGP